ncbi:MAG: OmpA family protein [Proteobacteria bacterium]|nr:OmpA family protein [Pseudomonadota bacterium]MBI3497547.1 OmpA family protein [Pseudomonadota bacterium]
MKKWQTLLCFAALALLAGCIGSDVTALRGATTFGGKPFTAALTDNYRQLAVEEATQEFDWSHGDWFARKGLAASKGEAVLPAEVTITPQVFWLGTYVMPQTKADELAAARTRLINVLNGGARDRAPAAAAKAQTSFDCWIEDEWEGDPNPSCRAEFLRQMTELEARPAAAAPAPAPAAPAAQPPVVPRTYLVFFDFDKSDITPEAARVLKDAADNAKKSGTTRIMVTGHTDTMGTVPYNQRLSERRAAAVKDFLVREGLPAGQVATVGRGKSEPLVPTGDGVREARNRRAEIVFP